MMPVFAFAQLALPVGEKEEINKRILAFIEKLGEFL